MFFITGGQARRRTALQASSWAGRQAGMWAGAQEDDKDGQDWNSKY